MEKRTYYIYCYKNPLRNNEIFYIGYGDHKRKCGGCRAYDHINEVKRGIKSSNKHKYYTIVKILDAGLEPIIEIVEDNLTYNEAIKREIELCVYYKETLTNIASGGDGGDTYSNQPEWKKDIIRKKLKEKEPTMHSEKWKRELSKIRIGKGNPFFGLTHTEVTKNKCGAVWRGKKIPRELVEKRQRLTLYSIICPDGNTITLKGRVEFAKYFQNINSDKSKLKKINWQLLLRTNSVKGYIISKKEEVPFNKSEF